MLLFPSPEFGKLNDFYKNDFNWAKIRKQASKIIAIVSENDPYHSFENAKKFADLLGVDLIVEKNSGHINVKTGFGSYPKMLELVLKK